jgi:hypothetical protein
MVLLGCVLIIDVVGLLAGLSQYSLLGRIIAETPVTQEEIDINDLVYGLTGILQVLVYLATAVAFCLWFHQAYKNLSLLGAKGLDFSPGWAVGFFFVPVLNLFRPYQVAKEIWEESDPFLRAGPGQAVNESAGTAVVAAWWAFFILRNIASNIGGRMMWREESPGGLQTATGILVAADVLSIVAAVCAILVVKGLRDRQQQSYQQLQAAGLPCEQASR